MSLRRWLCLPGVLALALAVVIAACDRPDPVAVQSPRAIRPAATVVPTPAGDLSITTVELQVPAGRIGRPSAVNSAGVIVGAYEGVLPSGEAVAVRWNLAGSWTALPLPTVCAGGLSQALGVSEAGDIVGVCAVKVGEDYVNYAILWPKGGAPVVLSTPAGTKDAIAQDVNSKGDVVGNIVNASDQYVPVLWSKGQIQILTQPTGSSETFADRITNAGLVLGSTVSLPGRPVLWEKGVPRYLETPAAYTGSSANGINAAGIAVGKAARTEPTYESVPLRWDRNGVASVLPIGGDDPGPTAISGGGWVVGSYGACLAYECAFLWSEALGTVVLSFPNMPTAIALAISDNGYIAGYNGGLSAAPALLWIVKLTPLATP